MPYRSVIACIFKAGFFVNLLVFPQQSIQDELTKRGYSQDAGELPTT
jgi:hypothetical protein